MTGIEAVSKNLSELFEQQQQELEQQGHLIEALQTSLAQKMLALEDIGWTQISGNPSREDSGLTLSDLHPLSMNLRDQAAANPLHSRGAQLRHAYIFGRGVNFTGLTPKTEALINNLYNQEALFSVKAHSALNLAKFTDGNVFVIRHEGTNVLTTVPMSQIKNAVTDPDDASRVRYFLREWETVNAKGEAKPMRRWYPVSRFKKTQVGRGRRGGKINKTISISGQAVPVAQDEVIYHETTKRQVGWTYGIPDSLAAAVWAVAYSEYLSDNAKLVKALQQFAWNITTASKPAAKNAAVAVATSPGVGGTSVMGSGNVLSGVGVPSAQVNMNNGQPLAAMVATSFGVPVIALLSSPGATGGSYGAATTLDTPTIKGMTAEQDSWKLLFLEILADMGSPDAQVSFPNISEDETYRQAQSVGLAMADGRIWRDEARDATVELLDIKKLHDDLPAPDEFNAGGDVNDRSNPEPSQGNTGAVPGGTDQDVTNHDGEDA